MSECFSEESHNAQRISIAQDEASASSHSSPFASVPTSRSEKPAGSGRSKHSRNPSSDEASPASSQKRARETRTRRVGGLNTSKRVIGKRAAAEDGQFLKPDAKSSTARPKSSQHMLQGFTGDDTKSIGEFGARDKAPGDDVRI